MTRVFDIADRYVDDYCALDPIAATSLGIPGHEREMPDYSPEGAAKIAGLNRSALTELGSSPAEGDRDRIAKEFMEERLAARLALFDANEHLRALRIIAAPLDATRAVFDQMPKQTADDWSNIAARLALVPKTLDSFRRSLDEGIARGLVASKRQARECIRQSQTWAGLREDERSFFDMLQEAYEKADVDGSALRSDLESGDRAAKEGYAEIARYLTDTYEPAANEEEAAGEDRYQLMMQLFLGTTVDPKETYEWGWEEQWRIDGEMQETAAKIANGGSVDQAMKILETDPERQLDSVEAFQAWLQELHDEALRELHGKHFDIDERIRHIEVMIPPPGGALAPYYTGPSEDFSRPGRTWWPAGSRKVFPKWNEVTTAYHEGVPGHHLQIGSSRCLGDKLSRYQKLLGFISGYGEGWALYAERLMGELGFLDNPDYYMGLLSAQALRSCRVIVDIGMHLKMRIPDSESFHPGEVWEHDLALEFVVQRARWNREMVASEIVRYLGWPGQAISYKVGERKWLEVRERAKQKAGSAFDLKSFHTDALDLGPMGLAQLEREMAA